MSGYACRVERDSISPAGVRLTTFMVTFPRFILAEVNTHRMLSRNSASSRAIPVEKRLAAVEDSPFVPEQFGRNQKGMQAGDPLPDDKSSIARDAWLTACHAACQQARILAGLGVHKQLANRLLEPFAWHTAIITATEWHHFFSQRCHPDAQPEFRRIACMMRDAKQASTPTEIHRGQWHLPMVDEWHGDPDHRDWQMWQRVSVGRCARVSYETHEGKRDPGADVALAERLMAARPPHASPFEHVATPMPAAHPVARCGNLTGWLQWRTVLEDRGQL